MKEQHVVRQGDVLLTKVNSIPAGAVEIKPDAQNKIVLAWGEVTGHHHRIENVINRQGTPSARIWSAQAERFLQVMEKTALVHEEHSAITLDPGIYKLPQQVEYTPAELRRVED